MAFDHGVGSRPGRRISGACRNHHSTNPRGRAGVESSDYEASPRSASARVQGGSWLRGNRRGDHQVWSPSSAQCSCLLEDALRRCRGSPGVRGSPWSARRSLGSHGVPRVPFQSLGPPIERSHSLFARQVFLVFRGISGALSVMLRIHGSRYRGSHLRKRATRPTKGGGWAQRLPPESPVRSLVPDVRRHSLRWTRPRSPGREEHCPGTAFWCTVLRP